MNNNYMSVSFPSIPNNESLARMLVSIFVLKMDPTLEDMEDIKTAVSEAVTNAIIHGYENRPDCVVELFAQISGEYLTVRITDHGGGIADIEQARQPFYTSKPELDRSGMGFSVMESFMDSVDISSFPGKGTQITMRKKIEVNN